MAHLKTIVVVAIAALVLVLEAAPAAGAASKTRGKTVKVEVTCIGTPDSIYGGVYGSPIVAGKPCSGRVVLRAKPNGKKIKFGSGGFSLSRGQTLGVKVKLTGKGRRAIRSLGKLKTTVSINSATAVRAPRTLTVVLKRPKK